MSLKHHGLSIGLNSFGQHQFISIKAVGTLTHADYEVITPFIESALATINTTKVDVLFDATDLKGWELRAAWDDFQLGLKHGHEFNQIAIYGDKSWLEAAAKIGNWFTSGEMAYFDDYDDAIDWLKN